MDRQDPQLDEELRNLLQDEAIPPDLEKDLDAFRDVDSDDESLPELPDLEGLARRLG